MSNLGIADAIKLPKRNLKFIALEFYESPYDLTPETHHAIADSVAALAQAEIQRKAK